MVFCKACAGLLIKSGFYSLQAENVLVVIFSGTENGALLIVRISKFCSKIFALHCVLLRCFEDDAQIRPVDYIFGKYIPEEHLLFAVTGK